MRVAAILAAFLIGAGLLWGASELHYQSCVDAAKAKHLVSGDPDAQVAPDWGGVPTENRYERREQRRREAIHGCSRSPL